MQKHLELTKPTADPESTPPYVVTKIFAIISKTKLFSVLTGEPFDLF